MKNEMRLQGIGMVEGTEAGKIQVGDILRWNYGGLSKVVSFELSKTGKTIICQVETVDSRTGEKELYERKMRTSRLVNIVASANTNNDFNLQFDPIKEEAPEAEEVTEAPEVELIEMIEGIVAKKELSRRQKEVEHVVKQIEESTDLKKSVHEVAYRVTNHGSYVEVMLFVTDVANDVTLVAQQEGEFDSMEEAETLISYLKKTGNKIEFVETIAYTG
jgi:glutamyl/glutaminyl-tRNA synthetase